MNNIKDKDKIKVFYNDTCPICKREIDTYKLRSSNIEFSDSSLMDDKYNRRMHAYKDGVEYVGAEAFLFVWRNTRGFKWLSYLFNNKISIIIMNLIYEPLALIIYKMHLKRLKKNK